MVSQKRSHLRQSLEQYRRRRDRQREKSGSTLRTAFGTRSVSFLFPLYAVGGKFVEGAPMQPFVSIDAMGGMPAFAVFTTREACEHFIAKTGYGADPIPVWPIHMHIFYRDSGGKALCVLNPSVDPTNRTVFIDLEQFRDG